MADWGVAHPAVLSERRELSVREGVDQEATAPIKRLQLHFKLGQHGQRFRGRLNALFGILGEQSLY